MTPFLKKEGKVLTYNTITFSSSLRRSTPTVSSGGGGGLFQQPQRGLLFQPEGTKKGSNCLIII
jgi:hypothetical protein